MLCLTQSRQNAGVVFRRTWGRARNYSRNIERSIGLNLRFVLLVLLLLEKPFCGFPVGLGFGLNSRRAHGGETFGLFLGLNGFLLFAGLLLLGFDGVLMRDLSGGNGLLLLRLMQSLDSASIVIRVAAGCSRNGNRNNRRSRSRDDWRGHRFWYWCHNDWGANHNRGRLHMFRLVQCFQETSIIVRGARWRTRRRWGSSRHGRRDWSNRRRCFFGLLLLFLGLFLRLGRRLWLAMFGLMQGLKDFGLVIRVVCGGLGLGRGPYTDGDATRQYGEFSISHNYFLE
jgi:hypothetical protein